MGNKGKSLGQIVLITIVVGLIIAGCNKGEKQKPYYFYGLKGPFFANSVVAENFNEPTDGPGYLNRAVAYINAGQYDKAISDCNKALETMEGYPPAIGTRCLAYLNAGKYDLAIEDIDFLGNNFFSGSPNDAWILYIRGKLYSLEGNKEDAEDYYNRAVTVDPDYSTLDKYF